LAIDPLCKKLFSFFFRIYERKHFPHLHSTTHLIGWTRERGEDFREHATGKVKRGFACPPSCVRKREREAVLPHTTTSRDRKWEKTWNLACGST
jgi:hypothetical protein